MANLVVEVEMEIPQDIFILLDKEAKSKGIHISEVIREALKIRADKYKEVVDSE